MMTMVILIIVIVITTTCNLFSIISFHIFTHDIKFSLQFLEVDPLFPSLPFPLSASHHHHNPHHYSIVLTFPITFSALPPRPHSPHAVISAVTSLLPFPSPGRSFPQRVLLKSGLFWRSLLEPILSSDKSWIICSTRRALPSDYWRWRQLVRITFIARQVQPLTCTLASPSQP